MDNGQRKEDDKGGEDEYFVDCQYEYFFVSDFNHYGFISYHAGECTHQVAEKGIVTRRPEYQEAGYQEIRKIEQIKKVFN